MGVFFGFAARGGQKRVRTHTRTHTRTHKTRAGEQKTTGPPPYSALAREKRVLQGKRRKKKGRRDGRRKRTRRRRPESGSGSDAGGMCVRFVVRGRFAERERERLVMSRWGLKAATSLFLRRGGGGRGVRTYGRRDDVVAGATSCSWQSLLPTNHG